MKHLKPLQEINNAQDRIMQICNDTPSIYPVFKMIKDYYAYNKGDKFFCKTPHNTISVVLTKLDVNREDVTYIPPSYMRFIGYKTKIEIDEDIVMMKNVNKYNL